MRRMLVAIGLVCMCWPMTAAQAGRDEDQVVQGVISGLLGVPPQPTSASYTAQEKERLVTMLQSGEYVTSRQGEPVDAMVYGIPLTHTDHVYTARPIRPSQAYQPSSR